MVLDLYTLAGGLTDVINPTSSAILRRFSGIQQADDLTVTPQYDDVAVDIDVQALSTSDLQFVENIQQQSDARAVYLRGEAGALNRPLQQGGDVLIFDDAQWLITQVLEEWGSTQWRKVICTRQLEPAPPHS